MRIGVFAVLFCTLLFALFVGHKPSLHALDDFPAMQASDLAGSHADDGPQPPPVDDGADHAISTPTEVVSETIEIDGPIVAPVQMPPLVVGQNGGETIMIATGQSGDVISVVKFTPGLDDPLQPAQQVETIFDLGIGVNANLTWDIAGNSFTFSFGP